MKIGLVAEPRWVNLAVLVPIIVYFAFRRRRLPITVRQLILLGVFAIVFGFLEAAVVVYLRAASGLLQGYSGTLADVVQLSRQSKTMEEIRPNLLTVEVLREAATLLMLGCAALLTSVRATARLAAFLWAFAIWDIVYYLGLWATLGWPHSIRDSDILFLIPAPWFAPVWFPVLVSALTLVAILLTRTNSAEQ